MDAIQFVQCPSRISVLHDVNFFRYGRAYYLGIHGQFITFWDIIQGMPQSFETVITSV